MTFELVWRLVGMIALSLVGARLGAELDVPPLTREATTLLFGMVGALTGLILTPYFTTRPARLARAAIMETPAETLVTAIIGLLFGLAVAALAAVPLSLLPSPLNQWLPVITMVAFSYLSVTIFALRAQDLVRIVPRLLRPAEKDSERSLQPTYIGSTKILVDSSAIIDGRILDISKTGFIQGELIVPSFVLREIQHIADDSNTLRRNRGRRGLEILEELQRESKAPVQLLDVDVETAREVDHKLIALAKQMNALLLTTDYTLKRTANLQGVEVLNINELANAVKAVILPNEVITLQIIAEGREPGQGVGYLDDGTMVVVEDGRRHLDRKVDVVIVRMIQTSAGKMYFARLDDTSRK
ncbi:MAG: PIN domain nuclease [Anaerolineae bacterium]|nr:PIN domain nuclease [Anaerolineae bacterium]MDW8297886.1 PIN domain nuclease [Anaerolineae bacterium]